MIVTSRSYGVVFAATSYEAVKFPSNGVTGIVAHDQYEPPQPDTVSSSVHVESHLIVIVPVPPEAGIILVCGDMLMPLLVDEAVIVTTFVAVLPPYSAFIVTLCEEDTLFAVNLPDELMEA